MSQRIERQTKSQDSKALTCHWDTFGRNVGYSVDGDRKQSITYDSATGRIAESDGFRWDYLAGSNLKSQLTYPNEAVVTWSYEPHRDLLTAVTNATYSTYVYTNDLLGRRTSKSDEQYGYNARDELIAADEVSYAYDDIGNRTTAEGKTYTANNLNQYTAIDDFVPEYDADGNQTLVKTETGIWSVSYNAENRPIRWQSGDTVITMAFDRMGRRVEMRTVKDGAETLQRFVYDNYLCIQQLRGADNALFHSYVWDPTESVITRPLLWLCNDVVRYYLYDGHKNVSEIIATNGDVVANYGYSPFGITTVQCDLSIAKNPWSFSAEFADSALALMYYNFRHYNALDGRWISRDPLGNIEFRVKTIVNSTHTLFASQNTYSYVANSIDRLGLYVSPLSKDEMTECQRRIQRAITVAKKQLDSSSKCKCRFDSSTYCKGNAVSRLTNLEIVIDNESDYCLESAYYGYTYDTDGKWKIYLCPRTCRWGYLCLAETILHELFHECKPDIDDDDGSGETYDVEKDCGLGSQCG